MATLTVFCKVHYLKNMYKSLKFFFLLLLTSAILLSCYLTVFGYKTDKFNDIIYKKLDNKNNKISYKLEKIKIYLDPLKLSFKIETKNSIISLNNSKLLIEKINANLPIISLIKKQANINNIEVKTQKNEIKDILKFIKVYQNNFQIMILDKSIKRGNVSLFIKFDLDKVGKIKKNFLINGDLNDLEMFFFKENSELKSDFKFEIKNNLINIFESSFNYKNIIYKSNNIEILQKNKKLFNIKGDIYTKENKINIKNLPLNISNKLRYFSNKKIEFKTKNKFSFNLNNKLNITNINISSECLIKKLNLPINKNVVKKFNFLNDSLSIADKKMKINLKAKSLKEIEQSTISIVGNGKYAFKEKYDDFSYTFKKENLKKKTNLSFNVDYNEIDIDLLKFKKKTNDRSKLEINFEINSKNSIIFNEIKFINSENKFLINKLKVNEKYQILDVEKISLNYLNNENKNNDLLITKDDNFFKIKSNTFDGSRFLDNFLNTNNKNEILAINPQIILNFDKLYVDEDDYLMDLDGSVKVQNNKIKNLDVLSNFQNGKTLNLKVVTKDNNERITNLYTTYPKPLIKRYKFIKGFDEGVLDFRSNKINGKSNSVLIIDNFKIKEVPLLAKILTLASLQGIADLLTGEGIRFTDFEMKFSNEQNIMKIEEVYAIGPAISLMVNGYLEKNVFTSLEGTLVPATTINRSISSIPILGDILVGKKVGEGVFGVSFKIKGNPKNLKTTVDPIKTLTPRFITRTLEQIKN
tara:strand:+ start:2429 stop:4687 length:2259 start_codon:yes stop_codon:yes gene_type:complete